MTPAPQCPGFATRTCAETREQQVSDSHGATRTLRLRYDPEKNYFREAGQRGKCAHAQRGMCLLPW